MTITCDSGWGDVAIIIEVILHQVGEAFRCDAIEKPVAVTGIDPKDMRPQPSLQLARPPAPAVRPSHLAKPSGNDNEKTALEYGTLAPS